MKIVLLSGGSSIHTIRWANGFSSAGLDVHLVSQQPLIEPVDDRVNVIRLPDLGAVGYFTMVPFLRRILKQLRPAVLNAHYASGYGTAARLSGYRPCLLSVWGSDVYDFPNRSTIHRWWLKKNLLAADKVASTSICMALRTKEIMGHTIPISVTPFGVEINRFAIGRSVSKLPYNERPIVIGIVKVLAPIYGIDTLIEAFSLLHQRLLQSNPDIAARLRLRIVGDGPSRQSLEALAGKLRVSHLTDFVGRVAHDKVPEQLSMMDIFAALSRLESFGVAVIEAGAAEKPVVVSDAGGLPEVVVDGVTGLVVPRDNPELASIALESLVKDSGLRRQMGLAARIHVSKHYSWESSVAKMVGVLEEVHRNHVAENPHESTQ